MRNVLNAVAATMLLSASLAAQERAVPGDKVPSAVKANAHARFPNARITGVVREKEDDGTEVFEVTLKQAGRNIDLTTALDGQLRLIEQEIAATALPSAVRALLDRAYPRARLQFVEKVTSVASGRETLAFYEVLLVDQKKETLEVQLAPDGSKVLKVEKKKPGDPD